LITLTLAPVGCGGIVVSGGYYGGHYGHRPWYGYRDRYIVIDRPSCIECEIDPDEPIAVPMPEYEPDFGDSMPVDFDIPDIPMDF
jgi:hypothetical protein